jgi:hypothetical protein
MSTPSYRDLYNVLKTIPEDRLDDNISVRDAEEDEYYPVQHIGLVENDDVLETGSVYLVIKQEN